jgi:4-amino-4-deoxy-L-arabinose transferase-like glycosyltransferase
MTETQTSEPTRHDGSAAKLAGAPFPYLRRGLTLGGIVLIATNFTLRVTGFHSVVAPTVLWASAALCFLASFIIYMMEGTAEPQARREEAAPDAERPASGVAPNGGQKPNAEDKGDSRRSTSLVRRGNSLRLARGGITVVASSIPAVILMGYERQMRWGVPLGTVLVAIAAWGVMDLFGTFDDAEERIARSTSIEALGRPLLAFAAALLLFCAALGFATAGRGLPEPAWGILVTLAFVGAVAALFEVGRTLGAWTVDETGVDRPLWKRHGFWLVAIAAALYFPLLGTSSLWDPWETHYGEVSREILARDDWISLWWAQDGWFWSKPVLDMWMQALAMATLGVNFRPDKMLTGDGTAPLVHPEWAVRAPVVLLTILSLYLLYKGAAKSFGRRAALLGALVLATMPDFYLLAHQTMTDMPFVAPMMACMGLVLLGLRVPEDLEARVYAVTVGRGKTARRFGLSTWHLVFGAIVVCVLAQILYLLSRNIQFQWHPGARGFLPHWDEFRSGSGLGNCGLPGNEDCRTATPANIPHSALANPSSLWGGIWRAVGAFEPAVQALLWAALLGVVLYMSWGERRLRRLYYLAAWFFAGISTLGKGPAGFGLPILVTLAYLVASRPGEELQGRILRAVREITQFEIVAGLLVVAAVALPWYVAMYVRHGAPFTDRLIFHDMFNRAFHHVHDTNEGDDTSFRFYVWQLGYALFPWTGLAPLGLLWWLRRKPAQASDDDRVDASVLLCLWFVFGFALFSFMGTKFHHYIFPAIPPVAMLIGVVLDDMIGQHKVAELRALPFYFLGLLGGITLTIVGIARTLPGSFFGSKPDGHLASPTPVLGAVLAGVGTCLTALIVMKQRARNPKEPGEGDSAEDEHSSRMLGAGAVASALLLGVVARDLIIKPEGSDQPGAIRLVQLFTYNYKRAWPDSLDFSAALAGFAAVAVVLSLALAVRSVRQHAVAAFGVFAFVWAVWGLDVYMQRTAQHWGQREVIAAYYADRASPQETLVAYQMNWKGENFYTGNKIPAFVSTGSTFTTWLKKQRETGAKVMYFITEHGRIGGLKGEVAAKAYREVTDKTLCNKFILVRAEL